MSARSPAALVALALTLIVGPTRADSAGFALARDAFGSSGGFVASPTLLVGYTSGQPAAGPARSPGQTLIETAGFWNAGTVPVLDVEPPPRPQDVPRFAFGRVAPNPTAGLSRVQFSIPDAAAKTPTRVVIVDVTGRIVRVLANGVYPPGRHALELDGRDGRGRPLGAGLYFLRMECGPFVATRRMVLIR